MPSGQRIDGRSRVFWTAKESADVVRAAALARQADPKLTPIQALRKAEEILPESRRRNLKAITPFTGYLEALDKAERHLKQERARKEKALANPGIHLRELNAAAPAPVLSELETVLSNLFRRAFITALTSHDVREAYEDNVQHLAEREREVSEKLVEPAAPPAPTPSPRRRGPNKPKAQLGTYGMPSPGTVPIPEPAHKPPGLRVVRHNPVPPPSPEPKPDHLRVLIFGLLNDQANDVTKDFGDLFDLRFLSKDAGHAQIRATAEGSDLTIGITKFISHSHDATLTKYAPHYERISGGVTDLKRFLARRLPEDQQVQKLLSIG